MNWLVKVDRITYVCAKRMIEKWAWYHTEVEGGKFIKRIDDVYPDNPHSSMKLWCIDYGSFGIALVEGIDRQEKSQVSLFVDKHGDHSVQHVAYETVNLKKFSDRLESYNCKLRGDPIVRKDHLGLVNQVFCKGYSQLNTAENSFAEYVERPRGKNLENSKVTFSQKAGKGFYQQIEEGMLKEDVEKFTYFSAMPYGWQPPLPES